jgi:Asp-tRNA(Asn)/Glu-tRNA(Gln) amidotransferase C subunit
MSIREKIFRLFKRSRSTTDENAKQMSVELHKLMQMVENTQEVELSCEEVFEIIDQYTEMVLRGDDTTALMPLVEHHIEICPDCKEEFDALLRILEATPA